MVEYDCGEIPVLDVSGSVAGVVTDRDIVCRIVAEGKNPVGYTVETCMSHPVVTVSVDDPLERVMTLMTTHRIRRVPVLDESGACAGMISLGDVSRHAPGTAVATLVRRVSRSAA